MHRHASKALGGVGQSPKKEKGSFALLSQAHTTQLGLIQGISPFTESYLHGQLILLREPRADEVSVTAFLSLLILLERLLSLSDTISWRLNAYSRVERRDATMNQAH
jgi:hypothetical protein